MCPIFSQRFCLAACLYSRILSVVLPCTYSFNEYHFTVNWQAHTAPVQQLAHTYCGIVLKSSLIILVQCVSPAFVKACLIQTCLSYQRGKKPTNPLELSMGTINNAKKKEKKTKKKNSTLWGMPCCCGTNEEVRYWSQFGNELCVCSRLTACPKQEESQEKMGNGWKHQGCESSWVPSLGDQHWSWQD